MAEYIDWETAMDVKEKMVELLRNSPHLDTISDCTFEQGADWLIANGVTVQEWIPVKDRLPEHGDVVMVWHTYMERPFVCQWDERSDCWIDDKWAFGRNTITHWCRLPQSPKGG